MTCAATPKKCAVVPVFLALIDEFNVGLMDERGGLEGVIAALAPHVARRDPVRFDVDA